MTSTEMKPTVLFVCVHNAGRSQMAAGFLRELGADRVEVPLRWQRAEGHDQPDRRRGDG